MSSKDNRKSKRVEAKHFISYDLLNPEGEIVENGMALSLDLSREGVLLENRTDFSQGATVNIHIAVGEEVVHLKGKAKHSEQLDEGKYQIGIHFEDMTEEKAEKIAQFYPDIFR
jgi:hypothetical protein